MNFLKILQSKPIIIRLAGLCLLMGIWLLHQSSMELNAQPVSSEEANITMSPDQNCDCSSTSFSIHRSGGQSGVGHKAMDFAIKNTGTTSCCFSGYPQLQFEDDLGRPVNLDIEQANATFFMSSVPSEQVVLKPGAEALFQVAYSSSASGDNGCSPVQKLRVKLPGTSNVTLNIDAPAKICDGKVVVSPLYIKGKR